MSSFIFIMLNLSLFQKAGSCEHGYCVCVELGMEVYYECSAYAPSYGDRDRTALLCKCLRLVLHNTMYKFTGKGMLRECVVLTLEYISLRVFKTVYKKNTT